MRNWTLLVKQHRTSPTDNMLQTITTILWEPGSVIDRHRPKPAAEPQSVRNGKGCDGNLKYIWL